MRAGARARLTDNGPTCVRAQGLFVSARSLIAYRSQLRLTLAFKASEPAHPESPVAGPGALLAIL